MKVKENVNLTDKRCKYIKKIYINYKYFGHSSCKQNTCE